MVRISPGDTKAYYDGKEYILDCAPYIKDERTMVPLRFVSSYLGCKVTWDEKTSTVDVYKRQE